MADPRPQPTNGADVMMKEEPTDLVLMSNNSASTPLQAQPQPALQPQSTPSHSTLAQSTTPMARGSQTTTPAPPSQPSPHGSSTRVYLNQNVTPHLLEAMKYLAVNEPEKPLKWLADFLAQKSAEIEGA